MLGQTRQQLRSIAVRLRLLLVIACLFQVIGGVTPATEIYFNDFEASPVVAESIQVGLSGGYVRPTDGYAEIGHAGNRFANQFFLSDDSHGLQHEEPTAATLTLLNLPEHEFIDLDFLFARIDSWDAVSHGSNVDYFSVRIDGRIIFSHTFDWAVVEAESFRPDPGVLLVRDEHLLHSAQGFPDAAYDMSLQSEFNRIPHTGESVVIEWFADGDLWQGDTNESWAIDNIRVTLVPEPSDLRLWLFAIFSVLMPWRSKRGAKKPSLKKCGPHASFRIPERLETRIALAGDVWTATNLIPNSGDPGNRSVVAVDLTGDGLLDVLESNAQFTEALGNGLYTNSRSLEWEFAGEFPGVADLDQDGDLDVLFQNALGLSWLENMSSPDVDPVFHQLRDRRMDDVALLDLNHDGFVDVTTLRGDEIDTYLVTEDGPVLDSSSEVDLQGSSGSQLGDLDDDGLVDVISSSRRGTTSNQVWIRWGLSRTTWDDPVEIADVPHSAIEVEGPEVRLLKNGSYDVLRTIEPATWLVRHQQALEFEATKLGDIRLEEIRYVDVDSDGDRDVIALEYPPYSAPNIATPSLVWLENVDGSYEASQLIQRRVVSFDILQPTEGQFQVVAARTDRTSILEFQEHGFRETTQLTRYDFAGAGPWFLDLDGDDTDDMVTVWASGAVVTWQKGLGEGKFLTPSPIIQGLRYYLHPETPFYDVDQDGDFDFISGDGYWHENEWPFFLPRLVADVDQRSNSTDTLVAGDFNNDGLVDVVTYQALVLNQGSGQFEEFELDLRRISNRDGVRVSDIDGDGDLDLWAPQSSLWYENEDLEFTIHELPHRVQYVADVNGDGINELLAFAENETLVFLPNSDRTWTLPVVGEPVDLNQDGLADFVSTDICTNRGDDTFDCERDVLPEGHKQVIDFDGDGVLDFLLFGDQGGVDVLQRTSSSSADFDEDGIVGFGDFLILASEFGREQEDFERKSDLDDNGMVNFSDFLIFAEQFGA